MADIVLAKEINRFLGGAVLAPWDIGELPEEWVDAFRGIIYRLPGMRAAEAQVAGIFSAWENSHPGYARKG